MASQPALRPSDIVVACELALFPLALFTALSSATGISTGECHNAVRRLRLAGLVLPDERRPAVDPLCDFLAHGVPFAFPPVLGAVTRGVPTAHSAPAFRSIVESTEGPVWAHADGAAHGVSLIPLFPGAPALAGRNDPLYELLAMIDAVRVSPTRVRKIALDLLAARLSATSERR
jgi:hypothetical protein